MLPQKIFKSESLETLFSAQSGSCVKKVPKIDRYFLLNFDKKSVARCHQLQYIFIIKN